MVIRYTAIFIIFACGIAGAYFIKSSSGKTLKAEEELLELIECIRNKIMYFAEPVEDIYSSYECDVLSETGFIDKAFSDGWLAGIRMLREKKIITPGFACAVGDFGNRLGSSFSQEEINNCNYYITRADEQLKIDKTEIPKRSKLYASLSIAGALMTAIVLF